MPLVGRLPNRPSSSASSVTAQLDHNICAQVVVVGKNVYHPRISMIRGSKNELGAAGRIQPADSLTLS